MTFHRYGTAAPALLAAYGIVRLSGDAQGPGAAWTTGHLLLLGSLALFVPVVRGLRRRHLHPAATAAAAVALTGLAAGIVQAVIDLVVGFRAADRGGMDALFLAVKAHPAVTPAVYTVGPLLFYVGLLALLMTAAIRRPVKTAGGWLAPLLVLLGAAAMALSLDLLVVSAGCYWLALMSSPGKSPESSWRWLLPAARTGRRTA
ncbi:hypothetical protein ACFYMW_22865 [Streptomyces sp. NPDC006692]|uniref:hypothetical protein n=1 Tax=unclassified Streptomyces TaxID=2593676 RepID=UPI0036A74155